MENLHINGHTNNKLEENRLDVQVPNLQGCKEIKIPMPWGHLAAKWWGPTEQQPILAIHGWQDNAGTFDALAPYLAEADISILCIDLPGHGFSSPYPAGMYYYIFLDGIQIVRRIVNYFNWKDIQMIGHSLGGIIAFLYASTYPEDIECYISLDIASPAVRDPITLLDKIGDTVNTFLKYETLSKTSQPCYEYDDMVQTALHGYNGSCTKEAVEILLRRGMKKIGGGKYIFTRDIRLKAMGLGMMGINESLAMAERIKCRVMNIRANPGMKLEHPEYYDLILDQLEKNAAVMDRHVVDGMHHLHLNNADSIASLVINFIKAAN